MLMSPSCKTDNAKCVACPARSCGPCRDASPEALRALSQNAFHVNYPAGSEIVLQGDEHEIVGIVMSGVVKVTNMASDGRQTVVALLESGTMVGSITSLRSRFSYEAASPVTMCAINRETFRAILKKHPEVGYRVLEITQAQAESVEEWLTLFNCRTTLERVAGYLHAITKAQMRGQADRRNISVDFPIGRKDLASYLGTTPETLSRNFRQLAEMGALTIVNGKRVTVHNLLKLASIAGETSEELQTISRGTADGAPDTDALPALHAGSRPSLHLVQA